MTIPHTPDTPVSEQAEQIKRLADRYAEECVSYDNGDCSYPSVKDERDDLHAAIDALRARAEAAEQDARRWRYVRLMTTEDTTVLHRSSEKDLDAAIDAALAAGGGGGR
jgi:hypothetical protein